VPDAEQGDHREGVGASLAAALGCLQPGIDPIYLTVLSDARPVPLEAHGLVVGFTQAGSALGALTVWWLGPVLPRGSVVAAAVLAFLCSVATALAGSLATVLACRAGYGLAMGWSMPPPWRPMPRTAQQGLWRGLSDPAHSLDAGFAGLAELMLAAGANRADGDGAGAGTRAGGAGAVRAVGIDDR
jgi:MFS family permease